MAIGDYCSANEFSGEMDALRDRFDSAPLMRKLEGPIRQLLYRGFASNFANGGSPGHSWPPHKPSTVARHGPHPLLVLTGALRASVTSDSGPGSVTEITDRTLAVGAELPYVNVQQYGYPEKNIPARPYLEQADSTLDEIAQVIADYCQEELFV